MSEDKKAQTAVEQAKPETKSGSAKPAAGPHAQEHLTDHEKTPGTGSLTDKRSGDIDAGSE